MQNYLTKHTNYQRKQTTENPRKRKVIKNQTSTSINKKKQQRNCALFQTR